MGKYNLIGQRGENLPAELAKGRLTILQIKRAFRFGNSVQQVCNAIFLAAEFGFQTVALPGVWWIQDDEIELPGGIKVINRPGFVADERAIGIRGDFYDLRPLISVHASPHAAWPILTLLRGNLTIDLQLPPLAEEELVIHVRSGDIASNVGEHPGYGQPPLAFYQKVLESRPWVAVHIVTENDRNPVCAMLCSLCSKRSLPVGVISGELKADLEFLLRARSLVVGRGTFACAVASMSGNLRSAHMFESWFCPWGNPSVTVNKWNDRGGEYRKEILSGNWANSERQRRLMLNYPSSAISDAPASGRCGEQWKCSSPQPFF